jgi:putative transport protein
MGVWNEPLRNITIRVINPEYTGIPIRDLVLNYHWNIVFGRTYHNGQLIIPTGEQALALGDLTNLVGAQSDLDQVAHCLGEPAPEHLEQDLSVYDKRRFFVSSPKVAGHRLRDLDLLDRYNAIVTRIRRGDVELLPHGDTVLNMGDQVRVVARHEAMDPLANLFGDSYRAVSEIDLLTFSLGIGFGVLLGLVRIPLPGGISFSLGAAGGPLIVSLILGAIGRTGPLVWTMPYSSNMTIRQIGLVFFLAAVGTRSGYAFISTIVSVRGLEILLTGLAITIIIAISTLWIGYRAFKIPMTIMLGILSGMQTQTAVLGFATEQTQNEVPNIDYATIYPLATIAKIIIAQVLLIILK